MAASYTETWNAGPWPNTTVKGGEKVYHRVLGPAVPSHARRPATPPPPAAAGGGQASACMTVASTETLKTGSRKSLGRQVA